jgi:hypothetical protein
MGDPDVWSEGARFDLAVDCPPPALTIVGPDTTVSYTIQNPGNITGDYHYVLSGGGPSGDVSIPAGGSQVVQATLTASACGGPPPPQPVPGYVFVVSDRNIPGRADSCETTVAPAHCNAAPSTPRLSLFFASPHPNPSTRGATLRFGLSRPGHATLVIFAANGARVRTLASGAQAAGEHAITWDGRDARGARLRAGVYYAALAAEGRRLRHPVVVLP